MINISMLSNLYDVRRLNDSDVDEILDLCEKNTQYYEYCGAEITKDQILNDLHITPPGVETTDKYYVGFYQDADLVAIMDLIDGYPEPDNCYIGFFMMNKSLQGKNIGSRIVQDALGYLKQIGKTSVRLGIAEDNPQANHFWNKNGFAIKGKVPMDGWIALVAEKKL